MVKFHETDQSWIKDSMERAKRRAEGNFPQRIKPVFYAFMGGIQNKVRILPSWRERGPVARLVYIHKNIPPNALPEKWYSLRCLKANYYDQFKFCPMCYIQDLAKKTEVDSPLYTQTKAFVNLIDRNDPVNKQTGKPQVKMCGMPVTVYDWFASMNDMCLQDGNPLLYHPIDGRDIIVTRVAKGGKRISYDCTIDMRGVTPLFKEDEQMQFALDNLYDMDTYFEVPRPDTISIYFNAARLTAKQLGLDIDEIEEAFKHWEEKMCGEPEEDFPHGANDPDEDEGESEAIDGPAPHTDSVPQEVSAPQESSPEPAPEVPVAPPEPAPKRGRPAKAVKPETEAPAPPAAPETATAPVPTTPKGAPHCFGQDFLPEDQKEDCMQCPVEFKCGQVSKANKP